MEDNSQYAELEISFKEMFLHWDSYEDKMTYFKNELKHELVKEHNLFGLECIPLAKSGECDDVIYSFSNGKVGVVHLTYCKESTKEYPKFRLYSSIEEILKYLI